MSGGAEEQLLAGQSYMFSQLRSHGSSSVANQRGLRKREVGAQVPGGLSHVSP